MVSSRQTRRFLVTGIFVALAIGFWVLGRQGVGFVEISKSKTLSFYLAVAFIILAGYEVAVMMTGVFIRLRKGVEGEVKMLSGFLRALTGAAFALVVFSALGKLTAISAVVAGFAGLLLGWSLQAPVSGVAAWMLISLKRPFRISDRVFLPSLGLIGDVKQVGIMYTVLNQVGGAVGSEDAVGRDILIPNAMLFSQVVINYTVQQEAAYTLDEVIVRITFDSDWQLAEKILLNAAREVTGDIIRATGNEPYIRSDIYDYGIYMRLRYMTLATNRPIISHQINTIIFEQFQKNATVDFAIPYVYSSRKGVQASSQSSYPGPEQPVVGIDVDSIEEPDIAPLSEDVEAQVRELASRIDQMGLLQPIIVKRKGDNKYVILAGHQRLQACKLLGWRSVPAIVRG